MATTINEINTYFGRCRCCLNYDYLKNMWEEHYWEGEKEIYIEMLMQCFALSWEQSENLKKYDQICETCITRLRDASIFKKTVVESHLQLFDELDEETKSSVKIEQIYIVECKEDPDKDTADNTNTMYLEPDDYQHEDPDDPDYDPEEESVMAVEYLEEEDNKETIVEIKPPRPVRPRKKTIPADAKWQERWPKSERHKTYKQYTEEDLQECLEAVRNEELTPMEAAIKYNIPRRTIAAKAKLEPKDDEIQSDDKRDIEQEKRIQFFKEIKIILTYTNATPYRSHTNCYSCIYCSLEAPYFYNPEELRKHTRSEHVTDRLENIDYYMRPYWINEILKLDIYDLKCVECSEPIAEWNDMFEHLKEKHDIGLDQAYTKAVPYYLTDQFKCALCKQQFRNYHNLDAHMNAHYSNYVCFDCGDTFVAENRLRKHVKNHDIGKYACSVCYKVFATHQLKIKHEMLVHKRDPTYKCKYCNEKFSREYLRHVHVRDKHIDKMNVITCEICGKMFTWLPSYRKHKALHSNNIMKMHECDVCGRKCCNRIALRDHMLTHTGQKDFVCNICDKKYVSRRCLLRHMKVHKKDGDNAK